MVNVPTKLIKPRRFDIIIEMRGVTWRRIQFEVSSDEPAVVAHVHWAEDFKRAATSGGVTLSPEEAVAEVNAWLSSGS